MEFKKILENIFSKQTFIVVIIISLLLGGITGGVVGVFTGMHSEQITSWFNKNILGKDLVVGEKGGVIKTEEESATIRAVEKVDPSVVSIIVSKDLSKYYNSTGPDIFSFPDFFELDFPGLKFTTPEVPKGMQEVGGGTGFIISEDGLILTNKHVVSDEDAEYTVITNDGTKYEAQVLARDFVNDIAIVKIEASDLSVVELGDSDTLKLGQTVIAIGNALSEYHNTVTKGIISGINREITAADYLGYSEIIEQAIQTDAAINPGNSGGPLINLTGQVVGINTAVNREGQLVSFAIPINSAKRAIESVKKYGEIIRPFLGVRYIILNERIAKANNLEIDYGALILRGRKETDLAIIPGSPADKAGLVENDIILEINGAKIDEQHTLAREIAKYQPDEEIEFKIWHKGEEKIVKAKLVKAPSE